MSDLTRELIRALDKRRLVNPVILSSESGGEYAEAITAGQAQSIAEAVRKNPDLEFRVEVRTDDPLNPDIGRVWLRSDLV